MMRFATLAALSLLVACGGSTPPDAAVPAATDAPASAAPDASSAPTTTPTADASATPNAPAASADPSAGEIIGVPISNSDALDMKHAETDSQIAAAVLLKASHKECVKSTKATDPAFKGTHYEVALKLDAKGKPHDVTADLTKSDVSNPAFLTCVTKALKGGTYPAPGREITVKLLFPAAR